MKMTVPDDLIVDIRDGRLVLSSGARAVTLSLGRHGPFGGGPVLWRRLQQAYLMPALAQFDRAATGNATMSLCLGGTMSEKGQ